jgi:hypothetical protein
MGLDSQYGKDTINLLTIGLESKPIDVLQTKVANTPEADLSIFVHPLAEIYLRNERANAVRSNLIGVLRGQGTQGAIELQSTRLVALSDYMGGLQEKFQANRDPVLVVADESSRLDKTIRYIRASGYRGQIVYYPTMKESPRPDSKDSGVWSSLAMKLMKLGNNEVVVGGQYHNNPEQIPKDMQIYTLQNIQSARRHGGCVGALANNLLNGLQDLNIKGTETVRISPHVYDEL